MIDEESRVASALFPPGFFNEATRGLRIKDGKRLVPTGLRPARG